MKIKKDFLSITDLNAKEIWQIFALAKKLKNKDNLIQNRYRSDTNLNMVMLFEKPSLRTKLSFDVAISQLGGHSIYFGPQEIGLGKREAISDVGKVISSMADLIVARVFSHENLKVLAQNSKVPVINALSDLEHPCQALTDLFTIWEIKRRLHGLKIGYVGDGDNNVAYSLYLGAIMLGMKFACASPKGYWMKGNVYQTEDPKEAVKNADVVVTDTWVSMGDSDKQKRLKLFKPYQVNQKLMKYAKKDAIFMHCLPAYRGSEVTADVIDGSQSVVFQEAENRVHIQKALLFHLLG